jgi:GTP-binding protein
MTRFAEELAEEGEDEDIEYIADDEIEDIEDYEDFEYTEDD